MPIPLRSFSCVRTPQQPNRLDGQVQESPVSPSNWANCIGKLSFQSIITGPNETVTASVIIKKNGRL